MTEISQFKDVTFVIFENKNVLGLDIKMQKLILMDFFQSTQ